MPYYYSAVEPRRMAADANAAAAADDDTLLSLSLGVGDIYRNNAPAAARAKNDGPRPPLVSTPTPPAPMDAPPSPPVASFYTPLCLDALPMVGGGTSAFTPVLITSNAPTTPLRSHHKASTDDDAIIGFVPTIPTTLTATRPDAAAAATPPAPRKRSRSGRRSSAATATVIRHVASPPQAKIVLIGDEETVDVEGGLHVAPPYEWSTERVGVHHSLAELSNRGISTITGELKCKRCDNLVAMSLDLDSKFRDLCGYISRNVHDMDDRAPARWKEPALPDCAKCGQRGSMRPVIPADKHRINWVFLLLTEMLGMCTLEQLKHFCAHTRQHRTGAKDRVLYSTYMELCNQLMPDGVFDMASERQKRARPNED
nr:unnamed protein product [Digitaria exilis]